MSSPKYKVAHLILAAGASSRMGKPKQMLSWGATTLIENAIEQALLLKSTEVYVVLGAYYEEIRQVIRYLPVTILKNEDWKSGMGTSIGCGIRKLQKDNSYDGVLISLIDQPLLDNEYLSKLIDEFTNRSGLIIATDLGDTIGVPALFSSDYFNELTSLKADYGAKYVIKNNKAHVHTVFSINKGIDVDTIEEYQTLIKDLFK